MVRKNAREVEPLQYREFCIEIFPVRRYALIASTCGATLDQHVGSLSLIRPSWRDDLSGLRRST